MTDKVDIIQLLRQHGLETIGNKRNGNGKAEPPTYKADPSLVKPEPPSGAEFNGKWYPSEVWQRVEAELHKREAAELLALHDGRHHGWVNVAAIVKAGRPTPKPPSIMRFVDAPGRGLLYEGRYNALFGDSGLGKSLIVAALQADYLNSGLHVVHLEYDNNSSEQVVWRAVAAGAKPERVREFFHVLQLAVTVPKFDFEPALVTLDSVNAAIATFDVDPNSSSRGVDMMVHRLVEPFTSRGATALSIDHVGHSERDRPSNNRRKIQAVQGIMLRVEQVGNRGTVGTRWTSRLVVAKDNPGWCQVPVDQAVGFAVFDGRKGDGTFELSLHAKPLAELAAQQESAHRNARPLVLQFLAPVTTGTRTATEVLDHLHESGVEISKATVKRVLEELLEEGLIGGEQQGDRRTSTWHYYASTEDPERQPRA